MGLEQKLMPDLKEAMKAKDQGRLRGIRAVKSALLMLKTDGTGEEITEEKEIKLLQKLVKQRKDSVEIFQREGRDDLAEKELEEIAAISVYLPKQMDEAELTSFIQSVVEKTGATSMKDMGKVMGIASKELAGKAEGKLISKIVKELLG